MRVKICAWLRMTEPWKTSTAVRRETGNRRPHAERVRPFIQELRVFTFCLLYIHTFSGKEVKTFLNFFELFFGFKTALAKAARAGYKEAMKRGPKNARWLGVFWGGVAEGNTQAASRITGIPRGPAGKQVRIFAVERPAGLSLAPTAFSAIELLVVVALVLLLTTLYWGSGSQSRPRRQEAACLKNLQKLFIAMEIYSNEQAGKFPVRAGARTAEEALDLLVPHYTVDTSVFICPGSRDLALPGGEALRGRTISYSYYMGRTTGVPGALMSDRQVDTGPKAVGQAIFSSTGQPPGNNHGKEGGNLLFSDGSAQTSPPSSAFSLMLTQGVVLLNPK